MNVIVVFRLTLILTVKHEVSYRSILSNMKSKLAHSKPYLSGRGIAARLGAVAVGRACRG